MRQILINRAFPALSDSDARIDMMRNNTLGTGLYGIAKQLGTSDNLANGLGAAGSLIDLVAGATTGGGMLRVKPLTLVISRGGVDGAKFEFDEKGRVNFIDAGQLIRNSNQGRNINAQLAAGGLNRLSTDQGGHYIARLFDGPLYSFDHFAQNGNFNMGAYRTLEIQLDSAVKQGLPVSLQIKSSHPIGSERPDTVTVKYSVDGVLGEKLFFNRPNGK